MSVSKAILINGSPRGEQSASHAISSFLAKELSVKNIEAQLKHISAYQGNDNIAEEIKNADIIAVICPLYVDSLPSQVISLMEVLLSQKEQISEGKGFAVILSSGFPERAHSDTAIKMAELFCKKAGFVWLSGIALGGGGVVYGKTLEKDKKALKNITEALSHAADYISRIKPIPAYVDELLNKKSISDDKFVRLSASYFKKKLKENGIRNKINEKPYKKY